MELTVQLEKDGCAVTSSRVSVTILGLSDVQESSLMVVPNPADRVAVIKLGNTYKNIDVKLIARNGQLGGHGNSPIHQQWSLTSKRSQRAATLLR